MEIYLTSVTLSLLVLLLAREAQSSSTDGSHLMSFDETISTSSFGEPIFRLEPPNVINFANTEGATILCLASGSPKPKISWYSTSLTGGDPTLSESNVLAPEQSRLVENVTDLRQILHNGAALRLAPFKSDNFRPNIHSTEYRCVASNKWATIHSRSVLVQAAINEQEKLELQTPKVNDEFVSINSTCVLRCRLASSSDGGQVQLAEWFTSDGFLIQTTGFATVVASPGSGSSGNGGSRTVTTTTLRNNKFVAFKSGELHVNNVNMQDLHRTYGCRLRNLITGQVSSSSGLAQMILTDPVEASRVAQRGPPLAAAALSRAPVQVLHTISQVVAWDSGSHNRLRDLQPEELDSRLLLPCAVRSASSGSQSGDSQLETRWFIQFQNRRPIPLEQWAASRSIPVLSMDSSEFTNGNSSRWPRQTKYLVGPSSLAIEWPTRVLAGRYLCQLPEASEPTTLCDINVIIRQPLSVKVSALPVTTTQPEQPVAQQQQQTGSDLQRDESGQSGWLQAFTGDWLQARRERRQIGDWFSAQRNPDEQQHSYQTNQVKVRGSGYIAPPPVVRVGSRLQLQCTGSGYPIDAVRWFKNGQAINTQSSSDFQVEISSVTSQDETPTNDLPLNDNLRLLSSLTIRQVQPKDVGLQVFECFVSNPFGDRARAGLAVLVVERQLPEWEAARSAGCHLPGEELDEEKLAGEEQEEAWQSAGRGQLAGALKMLNNRALILEMEPIELQCPTPTIQPSESITTTRVEWHKWVVEQEISDGIGKQENGSSTSLLAAIAVGGNFNQLFNGDSRFVINGSSLQIRSPSKRHDESLYVCLLLTGETLELHPEAGGNAESSYSGASSLLANGDRQQQPGVHQSSLAASSPSCGALLALTNRRPSNQRKLVEGEKLPVGSSLRNLPVALSSISIKIVAKPKIDPFEFSRNLEEGMHAVVVCAIISGQSPVDISWFKDGKLLLLEQEDKHQQISVNQNNDFSSTLTFNRIQPKHSGLYTCVASNAFAATNHTSRLTVNVAPYFIDPPQNTQAILGSNVLVNCRAGGQPSPQIRWRKLVSTGAGSGGNSRMLATPSAGKVEPSLDLDFQMAPQQQQQQPNLVAALSRNSKQEFRIVTSNSHVQILENGSMIIREVDLNDASRYVCQAFNGINPSLSQVIDLSILSPAQFDVNYETVSVKRDSMIKFNCAPKGDQPMRIEWRKETNLLQVASTEVANSQQDHKQSKYSELAYYYVLSSTTNGTNEPRQRHSNLILRPQSQLSTNLLDSNETNSFKLSNSEGLRSSELFINFADRGDTGTFVCMATNAYGRDELAYRLIVQEPPDVALNVNVQNVQANSVKLSWTSPFDGNLPLSHFIIEYRKVDPTTRNDWSRLVVSTNKLSSSNGEMQSEPIGAITSGNQALIYSVNLRQLAAKSTYHMRVAAVNAIGQGGYSTQLSVTTAEEPPTSQPNDLRTQPLSSNSIKVLWRGSTIIEEHAPVKGYYISYRKFSNTPKPQVGSTEMIQQPWLSTASMSSTNTTGYLANDETLTTRQQFVTSSSGDRHSLMAAPNYEYLLSGLEKSTKYEIRVQPYNSMGVGPATDTVAQTLKFDRPNQPALRLVAAKRQSIELKWTLSGTDQQPILGFSLFYKCEYDDWQEIQLGVIYHYVIENLRCGNKYQIYLSTFNLVGRSDPSEVLNVRTEGTVPVAPEKGQFIRANRSEVLLDMSGWQSGGCSISSFMIQFKRLHDTNWFILSEGATPFASSDKITIPDLSPATWYKLLVTALNEAGSTNAEYLFATLTLLGEEIAPIQESGHHEGATGWLMGSSGSAYSGRSLLSSLNGFLFPTISSNGPINNESSTNSGQLLLPLSCILLLLVTSIASYIYYNRSASNSTSSNSSLSSTTNDTMMHINGCSTRNNSRQHKESSSLLMNSMSRSSQHVGSYADMVDEKQRNHLHLNHHGLLNGTLDAANQQQQQHSVMLESLVNSSANGQFQSFIPGHQSSARLNGNTTQRGHCMKLLSSANSCTGNSSSISTHSTSCGFEATSSSQASSSGTSGTGGAKAQLQLIDESSMIEDGGQQQQFQQYGIANMDTSPVHNIYSGFTLGGDSSANNHVDILQQAGEITSSEPIRNQFENLLLANQDQTNYVAQNDQLRSLLSSTSFASAADLLHRQQQQQQQIYYQQQQNHEPIYQRLDKFPANLQHFASINQPKHSQTLRFNSMQNQSLDEPLLKSMTLHRAPQQQQQQYQIPLEGGQFTDGVYCSQQQQQQQQINYQLEQLPQNVLNSDTVCEQQQQNICQNQ